MREAGEGCKINFYCKNPNRPVMSSDPSDPWWKAFSTACTNKSVIINTLHVAMACSKSTAYIQVALLLLDEFAWVIAFTVLRVIARFLNAYNVLKPAIAWCGDWGGGGGGGGEKGSHAQSIIVTFSGYLLVVLL